MPPSAAGRLTISPSKNLAQRHPRAEIAAKLGRSVAATTLKAHELKLSL